MSPVILILTFLLLFALILVIVSFGVKALESERKKKVSDMLSSVGSSAAIKVDTIILKGAEQEKPTLTELISTLPLLRFLQTRIDQAGLSTSAVTVIILCAIGGAAGVFIGSRVNIPLFRELAVVGLGCFLGALPYLFVERKRKRRLAAFEEAFPEAMDFLARSMRAGHAFSVSLEMMADDSPEPLGTEFKRVFHEQNLGSALDVALRNMASRVPLVDVGFFVSAVLMQRETGGNLAEILTKLAYVIRERFRLKGQVKAVSAHGRITAAVLTLMPIATAVGLMIVAPDYLKLLAEDPDGRKLIIGAVCGQLLGYYSMKRIVDIKV